VAAESLAREVLASYFSREMVSAFLKSFIDALLPV
jgi:hypothetical protein